MTAHLRAMVASLPRLISCAAIVALLGIGAWYLACVRHPALGTCEATHRPPRLSPDYTDLVIPPAIAPLNFVVNEEASWYRVGISATNGAAIEIFSPTPAIVIPAAPWRKLLAANRGGAIYMDVCIRDTTGRWLQFSRITNSVAGDDVDGVLVYRIIHPAHNLWKEMGIYQRDLAGFKETPVMINSEFKGGCCHCHAFANNRADSMSIATRSGNYGTDTLVVRQGVVRKIGIKLGFMAWHPAGRIAACTVNDPRLLLDAGANEIRDIVEMDSAILCWHADSATMKSCPQLTQKEWLETWPAWSPDGRYLYFCRAPMLWTNRKKSPPDRYTEIRYDLVRISYDATEDRWGDVETVLAAKDTGLSIAQPRISPDGRWLSFVMFDHGCWPIYHPESDLYLMDLAAVTNSGRHAYHRMDISSDQCDSWVSWSSNSRWIVFGSARGNILFNRPYLAYVRRDGTTAKPFVMPQKDPGYYASFLDSYTMPELLAEPVSVTRRELTDALRDPGRITINSVDAITTATPGPPGGMQQQ